MNIYIFVVLNSVCLIMCFHDVFFAQNSQIDKTNQFRFDAKNTKKRFQN